VIFFIPLFNAPPGNAAIDLQSQCGRHGKSQRDCQPGQLPANGGPNRRFFFRFPSFAKQWRRFLVTKQRTPILCIVCEAPGFSIFITTSRKMPLADSIEILRLPGKPRNVKVGFSLFLWLWRSAMKNGMYLGFAIAALMMVNIGCQSRRFERVGKDANGHEYGRTGQLHRRLRQNARHLARGSRQNA